MHLRSSGIGTALLLLAALAALAAGLMVFGARFGLWEPIVSFGLVRSYLNPLGFTVTALGIVGLVYLTARKDRGAAIKAGIATLTGIGLLAPMMLSYMQSPAPVPPIHDITTDTKEPPVFLVLNDARPGAQNTLVYGGPEIASLQKQAYPDIAPIRSDLPPEKAYARALRIGENMGWEIVAQNPDILRFEATARTPVYHFADDVVVVVTPDEGMSRIDIRSVSRVGRSDKGVNAARIRSFTEKFAG